MAAFQPMPNAAEMEAAGFTAEDFAGDPVEVWPENWPAWCLFAEMSGQWRVGFAGRYALDYTPLFARMERQRLDDATWEQRFSDVRVMEQAVLDMPKPT
jgi:hypothetical protein